MVLKRFPCSIFAFTVEQYAVFCGNRRKFLQKLSSNPRRIVLVLWLFGIAYCAPWLGLTTVRRDPTVAPPHKQCHMRAASPALYAGFFITDFVLFYVTPLAVAVVFYVQIARHLLRGSPGYGQSLADSRGSFGDYVQLTGSAPSTIGLVVPCQNGAKITTKVTTVAPKKQVRNTVIRKRTPVKDLIFKYENPSNPSNPIKTRRNPPKPIKTHQNPIKTRRNPSKPHRNPSKPHQNPSKPHQNPSKPIK